MKRALCILFIITSCLILFNIKISADINDYTTFIELKMSKGKLLENYLDKEYKEYYKKVSKRKMFGWRTYVVNDKIEATFISDTLYSFRNDGETEIIYELTSQTEVEIKTSVSSTGSISCKMSGSIKKFKNGLDSALKIESTYSKKSSNKESERIKLIIEPQTQAIVYLTGTCTVTNGVAIYYVWWLKNKVGGFEYVTIKDLYPRIEKRPL